MTNSWHMAFLDPFRHSESNVPKWSGKCLNLGEWPGRKRNAPRSPGCAFASPNGMSATAATCLGGTGQDPYAIWVSEIMLQQTRVAVVVDRYQAFMARFPTLFSLALAPEQEVLALWSGLGYYRRALMLHKAAQFVAKNLQGNLPATSAELCARCPALALTQPPPLPALLTASLWRSSTATWSECCAAWLGGRASAAPEPRRFGEKSKIWQDDSLTLNVLATSIRRLWNSGRLSAFLAIRTAWCARSPVTARRAANTKHRLGPECLAAKWRTRFRCGWGRVQAKRAVPQAERFCWNSALLLSL